MQQFIVLFVAHCSDGQLRLTDSLAENSGRVEICSDQRWKTFYNSHWSTNNARVVCIELGFRSKIIEPLYLLYTVLCSFWYTI